MKDYYSSKMNNKNISLILGSIILIAVFIGNPFYVIKEGNQAIITQFGKPIGNPITKAGLHLKIPFIQKITYFELFRLEETPLAGLGSFFGTNLWS